MLKKPDNYVTQMLTLPKPMSSANRKMSSFSTCCEVHCMEETDRREAFCNLLADRFGAPVPTCEDAAPLQGVQPVKPRNALQLVCVQHTGHICLQPELSGIPQAVWLIHSLPCSKTTICWRSVTAMRLFGAQ